MNQAQKRKKKSAALAVVLAAALALTGTFAWQSISQVAKNEAKDVVNPGGRLHDDFSGYNVLGTSNVSSKTKDIYVENFTDPDNGGIPIYARVKLTEYMETGEGAGDVKEDGTKADTNQSEPLIAGKSIDNPAEWTPYYPDKADDPFREYWELATGGRCDYMPTFNKDKSSLEADINGTIAGKDGDPNTGTPYDDYATWSSQSGDKEANYGNGKVEIENHRRAKTGYATVITMDKWIDAGAKAGPYWVFDQEDGWAYWAQPIEPGTVTGCLLNSITLTKSIDESWYYSINATGQFATAFDWGDKTAGTGFYKDGETVSDNSLFLLNTIAGAHYRIVKDGESEAIAYVDKGETVSLKVYMREAGASYDNVTWSIKEEDMANLTGTSGIAEDGTLTIDADQAYETVFTVIAKSKVSGAELARREIVVENEGLHALRSIEAGTLATATIDGVDWYVIAKDTASSSDSIGVLLLSKEISGRRVFSAANLCPWADSDVRKYLNREYLNDKAALSDVVKETTISTRKRFVSAGTEEFIETQDKVFLLSEADFTGFLANTDKTGATLQAKDYTYNGEQLAAEGKPLVTLNAAKCEPFEGGNGIGKNFMHTTRSPLGQYSFVTSQLSIADPLSGAVYHSQAKEDLSIRPAMWVTLAKI